MTTPNERLGPYTLLSKLGQGGMGEVYRARDAKLERDVAIKVLPEDLRTDEGRRTRFLREARAVAQLSHPNITTIHEIGESEGRDYIAFERVEGRTLAEVVAERKLPLTEVVDLALPLADAIAYAHERGIVHRDLESANVMVTSRGHALPCRAARRRDRRCVQEHRGVPLASVSIVDARARAGSAAGRGERRPALPGAEETIRHAMKICRSGRFRMRSCRTLLQRMTHEAPEGSK
jgi:serine/threonine protein kinase